MNSPGPIATEAAQAVVEKLTQNGAVPIKPVEPIAVKAAPPDPGAPPFQVRDKANPVFGTGAWWFQKGGPIGVICFLLIGAFMWMGNSQRDSNNALIHTFQEQQKVSNDERRELTKMLMNTQSEITMNMAKMARTMERMETKMDKKSP